jgi:fused signal recognition particle receptor
MNVSDGVSVQEGLVLLAFLIGLVGSGLIALRAQKPPIPPRDMTTPAPPVAEETVVGRLRQALARSREALQGRLDPLFSRSTGNEALFEDLETTLLSADVGIATTTRLVERLRAEVASGKSEGDHLRHVLREEMRALLERGERSLAAPATRPWVILVVGVNGSGKTTSIGKLAANLRREGKRVLLAAADTFRAAAIEQLTIWAERAEVDIVAHQEGADPGAVVYDALQAAIARGHDVVIIDTAGRLQTKKPLMEELSKVRRVVDKVVPGGPHETLLVVDGTMGQNALSQAKLFNEATPLTGVVVTKLDGTAKGGMVVTLAAEVGIPVKLIGIGEMIEDLRPFDPAAFVEALA